MIYVVYSWKKVEQIDRHIYNELSDKYKKGSGYFAFNVNLSAEAICRELFVSGQS